MGFRNRKQEIMFKIKFRIRIKLFSSGYYVIQYSNFILIPIWREIKQYSTCFEAWSSVMENVWQAEMFADKFKSIDDIKKWYKDQYENKKQCLKQRKIDNKESMPYRVKNIL